MSENHQRENKMLFLKDKSEVALQQCFKQCTKNNTGSKQHKAISNRQQTCIQYCSIKFTNAYSFVFDLVNTNGIYRAPESELKLKQFV